MQLRLKFKRGVHPLKTLLRTLQDMADLERAHGQASVQLRLRFKRGLHPFYPPSVELLRPRFCGPLLGALASHPLLQVPDVFQALCASTPQDGIGAWRKRLQHVLQLS